MYINIKKGLLHYKEIFFWLSALIILYFSASTGQNHFTICLFALLELAFCPGCGLGRSIAATMHGNIITAFSFHPIGPVALLIILNRIIFIIYNKRKNYAQNYKIATRA